MPMHYDILIVGAGSAGSVLAARLSEDPARRVALIEAGRWEDDPDIANPAAWGRLQGKPYDWAYCTVPQAGTANRIHDWPRGRLVGGSSCLHAMAHVRGHRSDFDAWAEAGGPGWTYDALLPWFRKSERFTGPAAAEHGTDGPLTVHLPDEEFHPLARAFMAAGVAAGYAHSGDHATRLDGPAPNSLTIRDGRRVSLADAYLRGLDRPNLDLLTGLLVDRILFEGTRATGIAAAGPDGPVTLTADRIVLSAGTIATPLILMRSGVGPADDLRRHGIPVLLDQPEVGRNLHDHLLGAGNVYAARQPVAPSRTQHSESLMYLADAPGARPRLVVGAVMLPVASEMFPRREAGTGFTLLFGQTKPRSRGRLSLGGRDPAAAPVIDPAYLSAEEDRIAMRDALKAARTIARQAPLDAWRGAEILPGPDVTSDADLDAFVARAAITHHHPAGTCRIGAVVDGALGVHGIEALSIVDASVIPQLPCGPINAAVVAMAERAAALLAPL